MERFQPQGTVAFLFTDIEGSTRRWEEHRVAMGAAVRSHDQLLRELITQHNGYVFKTVGDAFCATFARATDAAAAAVEVQRMLGRGDFTKVGGLTVRAAIHVGEAEERDGDYFGPTVNRVARLLGTAHGGQIVLSETAHNLVLSQLPPDTSTTFLGEYDLEDLAAPERVFQFTGRELRETFPALRAHSRTLSLPEETAAFIGREALIGELQGQLKTSRLLSLVGTGGIGKTRIALQLARRESFSKGTGVWFVDLASLADGTLVASVAASALGLRSQGVSPQAVVIHALQQQPSLLILDNCEHLVRDVADFCQAVLSECATARILTTTRERLRAPGEVVYQVPTHELPSTDEPVTAESALRCESVELFVNRARAVNSRFDLTDSAALLVTQIVRRVDGIALAVELAAAATRTLSLRELLDRLDQQFSVLTGGSRTAVPRQQTMEALIDWSWESLSTVERALFRRIGVFAGAWSLAAADAVCTGGTVRKPQLFTALASLVDKSLVVADTSGDAARYRMLTPVRDYARMKLGKAKDGPEIRKAHSDHMAIVSDRAFQLRGEMLLPDWLAELEPQTNDFRAALERCAGEGDFIGVARIAGDLASFWFNTGRMREGRSWIECAQAAPLDDSGSDARAIARLFLSSARLGGPGDPYEQAIKAKSLFERLGDEDGLARTYHIISWHLRARGRSEDALVAAQHGLDLWVKIGKGESLDHAFLLDIHATILASLGRFDEAKAEYNQAIRVFRKRNETEGVAVTRFNEAELAFAQGDVGLAISLASTAAVDLRLIGSHSREAIALANLAGYHIAATNYQAALDNATYALNLELRYRAGLADYILDHLAAVFAARGLYREASTLAVYVDTRYQTSGARRDVTEQHSRKTVDRLLSERPPDTHSGEGLERDASMCEESALELALASIAEIRKVTASERPID